MKKDNVLVSWEERRKRSAKAKEQEESEILLNIGLEPDNSVTLAKAIVLIDTAFCKLAEKQNSSCSEEIEKVDCHAIDPIHFATRFGRKTITFGEYLSELEKIGLNQIELHQEVEEKLQQYLGRKKTTETKAEKLLDLLLSSPFVTQRELNDLVDPSSIFEFASLLLAKRTEVVARLNAYKKNRPKNMARDFVRARWLNEQYEYKSKADFARNYVAIVRNEFTDQKGDPLEITEKTIKEVWLSDNPAAGKPAG